MLSSKRESLYWHNHRNLITQAEKQKVKEITDKLEEGLKELYMKMFIWCK